MLTFHKLEKKENERLPVDNFRNISLDKVESRSLLYQHPLLPLN